MKILYPLDPTNPVSPVAVMTPTLNNGHTIEQIAQKDVPCGVPYKIVEDNVIPSDRTFRDAWVVEVGDCNTGVGADFGVGSDNEAPDEWYPNRQREEWDTAENWAAHLAATGETTDD